MAAHGEGTADGTAWFGRPAADLKPLTREGAKEARDMIRDAAADGDAPRLKQLLAGKTALAAFLAAAFDLSPFLRDVARRRPQWLEGLFDRDVPTRLAEILSAIDAAGMEAESEAAIMRALRELKGEAHFLIALSSLAAAGDAPIAVRRLSDLADACVRAAVSFLLLEAQRSGKLRLPDVADPQQGSGWIVLAMGKMGAHELNL